MADNKKVLIDGVYMTPLQAVPSGKTDREIPQKVVSGKSDKVNPQKSATGKSDKAYPQKSATGKSDKTNPQKPASGKTDKTFAQTVAPGKESKTTPQTVAPGKSDPTGKFYNEEQAWKAIWGRKDRADLPGHGPGQGSGGVSLKEQAQAAKAKAQAAKAKADAEEKARMSRYDRKDRAEGGAGQGTGGVPLKSGSPVPPRPKLKPSGGGTKTATDKSRLAPKMTNFQRQRAKQLESEGYAGRSMTRAQAQKKATEKSSGGFNLKGLFGTSKKAEAPKSKKPLSSSFAKKNLAANQKIGKKTY